MTGVAFLRSQLGPNASLAVQVGFNVDLTINAVGWVWTDVTTDLRQANGQTINISPMGRSDEFTADAQPAMCTFQLDNLAGAYSKGPQSSHYPFVRRGTPVRILVTLDGVNIYTRFFGYIATWNPGDNTPSSDAWVNVRAFGTLHRLQQGKSPLRSPLTRSVLATTTAPLRQYWPLEDGPDSTAAASALPNGVTLAPTNAVKFGTFDISAADLTFIRGVRYGTDLLPQLQDGGQLSASFPPGSSASFTVQATTYVDVFNTVALVPVFEVQTPGGSFVRWQFISDSNPAAIGVNATRVMAITSAGVATQVCALTGISILAEVRIDFLQSGGNISVTLKVITSQGQPFTASGSIAGILTGAAGWVANPTGMTLPTDFVVGHVRIWDGNLAPDFQTAVSAVSAWVSYNGETATTRLTRLFFEEGGNGAPLALAGASNTPMGPQGIDTFVNLTSECAAADGGLLSDGLTQGRAYRARSDMYNQAAQLTIDASLFQLDPPFEPVDDDQGQVNLWKVSRKNGSSVIATDTTGPLGTVAIGIYDAAKQVNVSRDDQLPNIAAWLLHLSTVDEPYRYPALPLDLSAAPAVAAAWLTVPLGGRIDIINLRTVSTRHPPGTISLHVQGWAEILSPFRWEVRANCTPYRPQIVAQTGAWDLELAGQTLAANLLPGATSLSLATATGYNLFTTTARFPADFPVLLKVGGWPINVTAASGTTSPQTLTIDPAPNTSTIVSGTPVSLWLPTPLAL